MSAYFNNLTEEETRITTERDILLPEVTGKQTLSEGEKEAADEMMRELLKQFGKDK